MPKPSRFAVKKRITLRNTHVDGNANQSLEWFRADDFEMKTFNLWLHLRDNPGAMRICFSSRTQRHAAEYWLKERCLFVRVIGRKELQIFFNEEDYEAHVKARMELDMPVRELFKSKNNK